MEITRGLFDPIEAISSLKVVKREKIEQLLPSELDSAGTNTLVQILTRVLDEILINKPQRMGTSANRFISNRQYHGCLAR